MARSFILGGVSATGLATGKPFFRRVTRLDGLTADSARADKLTCAIDAGRVSFNGSPNTAWATGELLFIEFPSTTRTLSVQCEEARTVINGDTQINRNIKIKVMLTAPGQVVTALDSNGVPDTTRTDTMQPVTNGNFIEITEGDTATINARTKGVFLLIQHFNTDTLYTDTDGGAGVAAGLRSLSAATAADYVSLLVTAVLDHEGFDGSNGVQTTKIDDTGATSVLNKIWPLSTNGSDGVG